MNRPEIIGYSQDGPMDQWSAKLPMPSALASPEVTGPLPVVGSGGVVGPGLARAIAGQMHLWRAKANEHDETARDYDKAPGTTARLIADKHRSMAQCYDNCRMDLRRLMERETERQPQPNK